MKPFLDQIEEQYFESPKHIVADAGYGSEPNYSDILKNRKRVPLITYNHYRKEQSKKYKNDPFKTSNWIYDEETNTYTCPNQQKLTFRYESVKMDADGFERKFNVYECENCEQQKEYVRIKLSEEKAGNLYRQRKIDVEPVFGFLKAYLSFKRLSVRGELKVENEIGLALMAVNLRKYMMRE